MIIITTDKNIITLEASDQWYLYNDKSKTPYMRDIFIDLNGEKMLIGSCKYRYAVFLQGAIANMICSNCEKIDMNDILR